VQSAQVSWASSATEIATVSTTGLVSALKPGQVRITASTGGRRGSIELTMTPAPTGVAIVTMPGDIFVPFTTNVAVGDTVRFAFPAVPHNVIFARPSGAPEDIPVTSNRIVSRVFRAAGTFPYDCTLHPGMSGVVVAR